MPSKRKHTRDGPTRRMTGTIYDMVKKGTKRAYGLGTSYMSGEGSRKTIKKKKKKKKKKTFNRGHRNRALKAMRETVMENATPIIKKSFDMATPYVRATVKTISDKGKQFIEDQRVPRPKNNPSWVELHKAINKYFHDKGIKIDISIFMRAVEAFLNENKDISISKENIQAATLGIRGIGGDPGSVLPGFLLSTLKKEVTIDSVVKVFRYLFSETIHPSYEGDMALDTGLPGEGWADMEEKKRVERLANKVLELELKLDSSVERLSEATLPRDVSRYTIDVNHLLSKIADYIRDEAEDGDLINRIRAKCIGIIDKHNESGHKIKNHFTELMGDYGPGEPIAAKKKTKTKKTKKVKKAKKKD